MTRFGFLRMGLVAPCVALLVAGCSSCSQSPQSGNDAGPDGSVSPTDAGDSGTTPADAGDSGLPPGPDAGDAGDSGMAQADAGPCGTIMCPSHSSCQNSACVCDTGYTFADNQTQCIPEVCTNTTCSDPHSHCIAEADGGHVCECNAPQYFGDGTTCQYDFCYVALPDGGASTNGTCGANQTCTNIGDAGVCNCVPGDVQTPEGACVMNQCGPPDPCPAYSTCGTGLASDGGPEPVCTCNDHYAKDSDGGCSFVSICSSAAPPTCEANSSCTDLPDAGSYTCTCDTGYTTNGAGSCVVVDPCSSNPCPATALCTQVDGGTEFTCTCPTDYYLDGGVSGACDPVDQCSSCDPNATCQDNACVCNSGFVGTGMECHVGYGAVATGEDHACALGTDNSLWCWGASSSGQLGNGSASFSEASCSQADGGTNAAVCVPCPAQVGTGTDWISVVAGGDETCAIEGASATATSGSLWCWGYNIDGELGYTTNPDATTNPQTWVSDTPAQVGSATDWTSVSVGALNTCAIDTSGALWCWGDDSYGQAGNGTGNEGVQLSTEFGTSTGPVKIGVPAGAAAGSTWLGVGVGDKHICALASDGTLWCWGANDYGQVGSTTNDATVAVGTPGQTTNHVLVESPAQVTNANAMIWTAVVAGELHTCAIDSAGDMWCWGSDNNYQLGIGEGNDVGCPLDSTNVSCQTVPTLVLPPSDTAAWMTINIGTAAMDTCASKTDGTLWCWGLDTSGQLGLARSAGYWTTPQETLLTTAAPTGLGESVGTFGASENYSCAAGSGKVWCVGQDNYGQLGNCSLFNSTSWVPAD